MDTQNRTNGLFPRVANGNQSNAVQQANTQMSAAFGNRVNNNNSSNNPQNLFNLIQQILNQLWNRPTNPPIPDNRAVYGAPVPNPNPNPNPNLPIGGGWAQPVYGAPVNPQPQLPVDDPKDGWARPVYGMPVADPPILFEEPPIRAVYGAPVSGTGSSNPNGSNGAI